MYRLGKSSRKNLEVGWIDLKKAFDSSFRSFTHRLVDVLPLPQSAKNTLRKITTCWNSKIRINKDFSANYKIERGLPQGDALSPLLYCMLTAVVPYAINKMQSLRTNLPLVSSISIYMDDTKIYANNPKELSEKLLWTQKICNNLGLEFNNSKSATFGDVINPEELEAFPRLNDSESYKYLGIEQKFLTDINKTGSNLINATLEFMRKVNKLQIPTRMIARLMCNTLAPKILYVASHTFFKGKTSQIITLGEKLDQIIRGELSTTLRIYKTSLGARLYLPRREGGRGSPCLRNEIIAAIITTGIYAAHSPDSETTSSNRYLARIWHSESHNNNKKTPIGAAIKLAEKLGMPIEITKNERELYFSINGSDSVTMATRFVKDFLLNLTREEFNKSKYHEIMNREAYDPISNNFLTCNTSPRLESVICHAQERQILANNTSQCKNCPNVKLTLNHILTSCVTRQSRRLIRHNLILRCLFNLILTKNDLPPFAPEDLLRSVPAINLYVDRVFNEFGIDSCRPDLVYINVDKKSVLVSDIAVSNVDSISAQAEWKIHKYSVNGFDKYSERSAKDKNLSDEIKKKHKFEHGTFLPLIIGSLGKIQSSLKYKIKNL